MAFPFEPLDIHADLLLGGVWTEVTDAVRGLSAEDGRISITRATRNEASVAQPTTVKLALTDDGTFAWRDPTSPYFGQLKRGTPLRVYRGTPHVGAANSDVTDTTSQVAPSVTVPADPGQGMLLCAWLVPDAAATWTVGSMTAVADPASTGIGMQVAKQLIASAGATGTRTATCSAIEDYASVSVFINGPTSDPTGSVSASDGDVTVDGTAGDWWVLIAGFSSDPATDADVVLRPPAAPLDSDGGGWILLADSGSVQINDTQAEHIRVKAWVKQVRTTNAAHTIEMPASSTVDEQVMTVKRIPAANVHLWDIRAHTRISSLPNRRDRSGASSWVPLEASGVLRAIDRRRTPSRSTIYRTVMSEDQDAWRVAYWSCEDARGATALGSAVSDVGPMTIEGAVTAADYDGFAGSEPIATLSENRAKANGRVPPYPAGSTFYRGLFAVPQAGLGTGAGITNLYCTGGTVRRFKLQWSSTSGGSLRLRAYDGDGSVLTETGEIAFAVTGTQFLLSVELVQDGSDIDWLLFVRKTAGGQVDAGNIQSGTFAGRTFGRVRRIQIGGGNNAGLSFGHQMIGSSQQFVFDVSDALVGHAGETAANRILRLANAAGIPCAVVGDRDDDVPMGPERPGQKLMANLRECAATGGGLLFEPRQFYGICYRTVRSLCGPQAPALELTFGAAGEIAPSLEPVPDDALVVNDITVSNVGGGTAQAVQRTGPLNVQDPDDDADGVGSLDGSAQVNVASSMDLPSQAHWRLHAGTLTQDRFPAVPLRLEAMAAAGKDSLVEDAAALDVGDRLTIDGLPASYGPDDISQLAIGFSELLSQFEWQITPNCVPEATYGRVLRYATAAETPGPAEPVFYGSGSAVTFANEGTTDTGITIQTGAGPDWTHEADFDVIIGGERMTVTAVGAMSGTFPNRACTLTVTRSVNGVVKSHPAGSRVRLFCEAVWGL